LEPEKSPRKELDPLVAKLIAPHTQGCTLENTWVFEAVDMTVTDNGIPLVLVRLREAASGREIRVEISPRDPSRGCYEESPSFNLAFASESGATLPVEEEKAVVAIFEAVQLNDHGRFHLAATPDGTVRLTENDTPPEGLLARLRKRIFGPK
jgi:hypothetical protein